VADLDRLLRADISHAAADAVEPPEFEPIERRGVRRRRTRTVLAAAAVVLVLLGVGGSLRVFNPDESSAPPVVDQPPRSLPTDYGVVAPGTYLVPSSIWSAVDFTITFPEDWRVREGNLFDTNSEQIDELGIQPFVVDKIYANACKGDRGAQTPVGPSVEDLVDALLAQPGPAKTSAQTTLGGYPATQVDLRVPDRLQTKKCFLGPGTGVQIWLNGPKNYLWLAPDGLLSIYVVDVDGERAVFTSQYRPAHTSPEDKAELQQVLDSIHIEK
jgi:hypothetical protein